MIRVLVVEDDVPIREFLAHLLNQEGFQMLVATNGEQAVALARQDRPDLIVMDMALPILDGIHATRRLKGLPETRSIPIIAVTGFGLEEERSRYLAFGCDEFEAKPLNFVRLMAKIRLLVGKRHTDNLHEQQIAGG